MENEMPFKIEKNIPIPPAQTASEAADTARNMEVGDCVGGLTDKEAKSLAQALRNQGFQQVTRKEEGGNRVWKKAPQTPAK